VPQLRRGRCASIVQKQTFPREISVNPAAEPNRTQRPPHRIAAALLLLGVRHRCGLLHR
jgi:hypothetical protein